MAQRRKSITSQEVLRRAEEQGFETRKTRDGWLVIGPTGGTVSFHPSSLDARKGSRHANVVSRLRRLGLDIDSKPERRRPVVTLPKEPVQVPTATPAVTEKAVREIPTTAQGEETWRWVSEEPGLAPREIAERRGVPRSLMVSRLAYARAAGLVRNEGVTKAVRVFPVDGVKPVVAKMGELRKAKAEAAKKRVKSLEVPAPPVVKVPEAPPVVKVAEVKNAEPKMQKNGTPAAGPLRVIRGPSKDTEAQVGRLLDDLSEAVARVANVAGELRELVDPLVEENTRVRAKLRTLEERVEKVLEAL